MQNNSEETLWDFFIIGGGINGTGIAADAAGRGMSVFLCEQYDLASGTSSASSKLIHGGLRYLEQYDFRLVRESLHERDRLIKKAPYLITPLQFIMPDAKKLRSPWLIRLGLFLYDLFSTGTQLPKSRRLDLDKLQHNPIKASIGKGFSYYDAWVDDARLVILNALAARSAGAVIKTRNRFVKAIRHQDFWEVHVNTDDQCQIIKAKTLINASGPWLQSTYKNIIGKPVPIQLVQGSHIIVPKLYEGDHAYILQADDNRVVFVLPYLDKYNIVGTTDVNFTGDPQDVAITEPEKHYLCDVVNHYFEKAISPKDIIADYAGVRPLYGSASDGLSEISRDYHIELNDDDGQALLITIFGGKLTTYRRLAEEVLSQFCKHSSIPDQPWTANAALPGAIDCNKASFAKAYPWLPEDIRNRYWSSYGGLAMVFLHNTHCLADLGQAFGAGLYEREVNYLVEQEWAQTSDDILWRRTKLGYAMTHPEVTALENYLSRNQTTVRPNKCMPM